MRRYNTGNVGGFPDIVIPGKTGYLTDVASPSSIASAIEKVIANPVEARSMAKHGQEYLRNLLDAKKTSKDVYGFYRQILKVFNENAIN